MHRRVALLAALALLCAGCSDSGQPASPRWPGPENTGVPAGTALAPLDGESTLLATPGQVVDGKDVTGCLTVTAPNVTLRRFRVRGCAREPVISVGYGLTGIVIEDCEIDGGRLNPAAAAVGYDGYTIRRCDIHGTGTGLHMTNNVVIEDNWVHDLHEGEDSHNDAVLTNGGRNLVVRHNTLENPHTQTAVVALYGDVEAVVDVVIEDNLLDGGGYTVYGGSVAGKPYSAGAGGIRFLNNRFGRRFHPQGGLYGPVSGFDPGRPGNVWAGNVWHDSGAPVEP